MPKRNLIWLLAFLLLAAGLWAVLRRDNGGQPPVIGGPRFMRPAGDIFAHFDNDFVFRLSPTRRERLLHDILGDGVLRAGDGFSEYIPPERAAQYLDDLHGQFVGIGIELDARQPVPTIAAVIDRSPAFFAQPQGILPGDRIVAVDGEPVLGRSVEDVSRSIRGQAGSKVELVIERPGFGVLRPMTIVREWIDRNSVRGFRPAGPGRWNYVLPTLAEIAPARGDPPGPGPAGPQADAPKLNVNTRIGYIRVSEFIENQSDTTGRSFGEAIENLRADRLSSLIIDLRSNPGGSLSQAVALVDRFVPDGVIVEERGAHRGKVHRATGPGSLVDWPIVVLVDRGTASAGEVVAGSLAFSGRAVLVGERTFGKGTVQELFEIPADGGSRPGLLKLTVAYLYLPRPPYGYPFDDTQPPGDFAVALDHWPARQPLRGGIKPTVEVVLSPAEQLDVLRYRRELDAAAGGRTPRPPQPTTQPDNAPATTAPAPAGNLAQQLLRIDRQLAEAVEILADPPRYQSLLVKAPTTAAEPADAEDE
jgi:C-terminal processing protease CtpA/Prc